MDARFQKIVFGLLLLPVAAAWAVPVGYSVNSDEPDGDKLYQIDLATGQETLIGDVLSNAVNLKDVEGLAFDKSGQLWGVDDESQQLVPINPATGIVNPTTAVDLTGLSSLQGNDFGMAFTCDDELFVSSVADETLYRIAPDGTASAVGVVGERISALASRGTPVRLFGLGNGKISEPGPNDNRSLYEIDITDGSLTLLGKIGNAADDYFEAGLSFDASGQLWAITDRSGLNPAQGSQVFSLNINNGKGTLESTTTVTGFESLAIAPPGGCFGQNPNGGQPAFPVFEGIPTLGQWSRLLAIALLAGFGFTALRRRRHSN